MLRHGRKLSEPSDGPDGPSLGRVTARLLRQAKATLAQLEGNRSAHLSTPPPSSLVVTPLPHCAVLVDRHVMKNGGTTVRQLFLENAYRDGWAYYGYGLDHLPTVARELPRARTLDIACL